MNLPLVVDIAIGLIFIYLVLSLLTSEIQELITTLLQWRAVHLKESIEGLLAGSNDNQKLKEARILANRLYTSPVINTLNQEAKGLAASIPRNLNQTIGNFFRKFFKLENVFGEQKSGPSFMAAESFATSFLETLGIPLIIQKFTLLRMQDFNERITTQVGESLQNASIAGIDETKINDFGENKVSEQDQAFPILQKFYNFKGKLDETITAFQRGGFDLKGSIDRLEEVLIQYIKGLEEDLKDINPPQSELIKNLKQLQTDKFGLPKVDDSDNSGAGENWSSEKTLLLRSWQPNLTEAVEIVKGFWQLKRCWSTYKRVREGAALDAASQLTNTIKNQPNISDDLKKDILNKIDINVSGSDYGYDKIKEIIKKHPKLNAYSDDVNNIIEDTYQQIKELIDKQPDDELPNLLKATLIQKIDSENRKAILSSLTYEFEKVRRAEFKKAQILSAEKSVLPDDKLISLINKLDDIIEISDEIIDDSYEKIKKKVFEDKKLSSTNKQIILKEIDEIVSRNLDIEYKRVRKEIENQGGLPWSVKRKLLEEVDDIINVSSQEEYDKFKKAIEQQPNLNLSVKQSLLLLATAITLRKDNELARLVDQVLGMGSLPESVDQNLFLLAQQAQIKVDGVKEELNQFRKEVENWFDKSMERSQGVYNRNAKLVSIVIGSLVAVAVNADTIHIVSRLSQDQILRSTVVKVADQLAITNSALTKECLKPEKIQDPDCQKALDNINQAAKDISKDVSLPLGWGPYNVKQQWQETTRIGFLGFVRRFLGWFLSGIALSMGASFWYDLLGKFVNVRNAGKVPSPPKEQANAPEANSSRN